MTPLEVANRLWGGRFKIKGSEIIPEVCPFCKGGEHGDKGTFALSSDTGLYNCKRSNSCGVQGNLQQLCKQFDLPWEEPKKYELKKAAPKVYKKPVTETKAVNSEIAAYLKKRGFSQETWESRGIGESNGRIVFPYYENGELVLVKFRAKDEKGKWKKFSMEPGGKLVFWGMDECVFDLPLFVTEGEFDALSLTECGIPNAVSLPNGASGLDCVDLCWEWLKQFKEYYIWTDNDEAGIKCRKELIKRLGTGRCRIVQSERKDANEVLYYDGKDAVAACISSAQAVPLEGLKDLADLPEYDPGNDVIVRSGIPEMDDALGGGCRMGEVSIWTGTNSSGKSTALGFIMLEAIEQGHRVCAYSGELPDRLFRYWVDLQAAGPQYVKQVHKDGRMFYRPDPDYVKYIRDWYRGRFYLYDSQDMVTQEKILEVFEYAYQRYGCSIFMVDNLMSLALNVGNDRDFYRKQANFVGLCKDFAAKYDVHIHIVAHPRKTTAGSGDSTKADVAGSGNITNWADNVFEVRRFTPKEIEELKSREGTKDLPIANSLRIMKNRFGGRQDIVVMLGFDQASKRFYSAKNGNPNYQFSWVNSIGQKTQRQIWDEYASMGQVVGMDS